MGAGLRQQPGAQWSVFIRPKGEPERFRRYPYGVANTRLIYPGIVIAIGTSLAIVGAISMGYGGTGVVLLLGLGVITVGVAFVLLAVWMAKRNL